MHPVDRLMAMEPAWSELVTAIVGTVAVLFVRRLLPPEQRGRGKTPLAALLLALVLMAFATVAAAFAAGTAARILGFLEAVLLAFGLTGLAGMLVFDVGFGRARVRVPTILRDLIQAVAFFIVLMGILREFGVNILSLVTTSAVLTAVIGLALQSTIANLFAGLALQVDRTVAIGDWVQSGARVGRVGQIKWRTTSIVTKDGDTVVVPNAVLLRDEVVNYSQPTRTHRMWVRVGFHYRHPPNDVKRILLEAVRDAPGVLAEPSPDVVPLEFGDSALGYGLRYSI